MREIQVLQGVNEGAYFVCDRSERRSKACISPFAEAKPIVKYSCTIAAGALNYRVREGNVCVCSAMDTGKKYYNEESLEVNSLA